MIITKTPFRVSFAGGGSDMAPFYEKYGGCVLSTSINKYMYISIHPYFDETKTLLKYSENELVDHPSEIRHTIFRQVLTDLGIHGVEISTTADVPGGTGLGSSSTFTVGLLHTLFCYQGKYVSKGKLAELACRIEIEKLGNPIGKQDQYAAAYGGLNFIRFNQDGSVTVEPVVMPVDALRRLEGELMMFYTGTSRSANPILAEQKRNLEEGVKTQVLRRMCGLAEELRESMLKGDLSVFGEILHENWRLKKELAGGISSPEIDGLYELARKHGASGGKLLGAGGGGFLLFCCPKERQAELESALPLKPFAFRFERDGASVVYIGDKYWR